MLKVYYWDGIDTNTYHPGAIWALAYDVKQARELIMKQFGEGYSSQVTGRPKIHKAPMAYLEHGSD